MLDGINVLLTAYGLSPMSVSWLIRFLGIEKVALSAKLYELYCVPLEWIGRRSATVRSFYEAYSELFALTD